MKKPAPNNTVGSMPKVFTFALIDEVVEHAKLSKGKARKAIVAGKVKVNGAVVRDPDMRLDASHTVEIQP